ncbi:nck-associated protein [Anaeramoeba ignava]|uniref:Nck-associated protein n=1 Tax=Anaeramoeba ignava TaxID=1746090 RepID=A0A9Q0LWZ3_ANAIG|nr:nck-associated protein [Anaeramoeba ignava]
MEKAAEKITILSEHLNGLLAQIYNIKQLFDGPSAPPYFVDDKMSKAIVKGFKKFGQQKVSDKFYVNPQFDVIRRNSKEAYEFFTPGYHILSNAMKVLPEVKIILTTIANSTIILSFDANPRLATAFLDLYTNYAKLILLISQFETVKKFLLVYQLAHRQEKKKSPYDFLNVCQFVAKSESPFKSIFEDLNSLWEPITSILETLVFHIPNIQNHDDLRKKGLLSITLKENMLPYPVDDPLYFYLPKTEKIFEWVIYGYLFSPQAFQKDVVTGIVQSALSNIFVVTVYRDLVFYPHQEFEAMLSLSAFKKLKISKKKNIISAAYTNSITKGPELHQKFRLFLKQEAMSLMNLLTYKPGLIAPKVNIVYSILGLCMNEIHWFLKHFKKAPAKVKSKLPAEAFNTIDIIQLIYIVDKITQLLSKRYYIIYATKNDYTNLTSLYSKFFQTSTSSIRTIIEANINALSTLTIDQYEQELDLSALQLNWFRCETLLSNKQMKETELFIIKLGDFAKELNRHSLHLRNIDEIEDQLKEIGGIFSLYPYLDDIYLMYREGLAGEKLIQHHLVSYLNLLSEAHLIINPFYPEELNTLIQSCLAKMDQFLILISTRISGLVRSIASPKKGFANLDQQIDPVVVAREAYNQQKALEKKTVYHPFVPGTESFFSQRNRVKELQRWELHLSRLCSLMDVYSVITIYDTQYVPAQYVVDALESGFQDHLMRNIYSDEQTKTLQKPSVFLKLVSNMIYSMKLVEDTLRLDVMPIVRRILLSNSYAGTPGPRGQLLALQEPPTIQNGVLSAYLELFTNFVENYIASGSVYWELNKSFYSRGGISLRADLYFNIQELTALCELLGPYPGVRAIDNTLLDAISTPILLLKDILAANNQTLLDFEKVYWKPEKSGDIIKKFTQLDNVVKLSINIGATLQLRELLHQALENSIKKNASLIYETVSLAFNEYPPNIWGKEDFLDMDCFAQSVGLFTKTEVDHPFEKAIRMIRKQHTLSGSWEYLPYLYAASFTSSIWLEANYLPEIGGHSNNAHCMIKCIQKLFHLSPILSDDIDLALKEGEKKLANFHKKFIEVSSFVLFQLEQQPESKKLPSTGTIFVLLDKFVTDSNYLHLEDFEEFVPYIFLRTVHGKFFRESEVETDLDSGIRFDLEDENPVEKEKEKEKEIQMENEKQPQKLTQNRSMSVNQNPPPPPPTDNDFLPPPPPTDGDFLPPPPTDLN